MLTMEVLSIHFLDVIVVAHKYIGPKLLHYFNKIHVGSVKIDLVLQEDEEGGSLDALLLIKDRIKVHGVACFFCDIFESFLSWFFRTRSIWGGLTTSIRLKPN